MSESISVSLVYDGKSQKSTPRSIIWKNRIYRINKLGFHHAYRKGENLYHVFSAVSGTLFFKLVLDTTNLHWTLEETRDSLIS